ncbi:MAG: hypothetical protein COT71_01610 [Candidatus Andersenbacteria bacterium CG10_big_fil_rev_8_21_14_0_10_54_11]|uniref:Nucleotidyl transferase AbiEii/AbiGii toxin family protein n=1 Tax=Candidatus Andersenbacteria bacterium CG10_big_fil_rev_8_21_14_0_10_54_11 TaxID=1974485 RepID=A0A2M6WZT8_9BACT|nr:MAG: hypothetical protein COT71_01610 [Candidatus Andersenbacteria bacterium CG10_big_fil_rev_8_21_14_0_10_54_11]
MTTPLITEKQRQLLKVLGESNLAPHFYLTGGTALAGFYLQHRHSEDLDFFSEQEVEVAALNVFWRTVRADLGIDDIEYQQSFNRNLFFLQLARETLKTEFTYFPFPRIESGQSYQGVSLDSLKDIAVNKLFTIYQQPRARDYIDLFFICREENMTITELIPLVQNKFEQHIDPLQLGTQFVKVSEAKDYPRMIKKAAPQEWQEFFIQEAKQLTPDILDER